MRRIKNRLVRLTTRVQTLREMLEKLMDDDSDMHAMHLTARAYDQLERQAGFQSQNCSCMQLHVFVLVLLDISVCSPELAKVPALSSWHSCSILGIMVGKD